MLNVAKEQIASLFVGKQGIKTIMAGSTPVYERPGGYVYLTLDTKSNTQSTQNQND